jgi:hypothetical protein
MIAGIDAILVTLALNAERCFTHTQLHTISHTITAGQEESETADEEIESEKGGVHHPAPAWEPIDTLSTTIHYESPHRLRSAIL